MIVESEGYKIDFKDALNAFKFDETDKNKSNYHGVTALKAVDIIAEFEDKYVFVEIKKYDNSDELVDSFNFIAGGTIPRHKYFSWLKNYLKSKFRDSFLYRYAENKVDRPIHYICLLNFDNALNVELSKSLRRELPLNKPSERWVHILSKSCNVVNLKKWNEVFTNWPAVEI
ncbi:MAG TPA: hypothetical protein PKW98_12135 [Candidatus Wallbacteria bacterium]|nr:MAG: hypothetical protein BWY32_00290 [bacterium ADurb.Bin243]HOD39807.1 hypothetical protein [Candidatus Wallbacteria bacterium]HPG58556.1 hypothetical protein [Candidatus Wallbacteria bacterium]